MAQEEIVETLINYKAHVNTRDSHGITPLYSSIEKGFTSIAKLLLNNNADVNIADKEGATALHAAVAQGK